MYKCIKCNKEFQTPSKLEAHKNRKNPCNMPKKEYKCDICNITFVRPSHKKDHEKTKKHINNVNNYTINGDHNNTHIGDNIYNNIIHLTLQTKSFSNTDFSYLRKWIINDVGNDLYERVMKKDFLCPQEKIRLLFQGTTEILEHLHFNLTNEDNHNLKILLMFPGFKKPIYEYLILEIEPNTNKITWNTLTYKDFIKELFNHLTRMNETIQNENFEKYIYYLKKYLIHDEEIALEMKSFIEEKLNELYINFNKNQKKEPRQVLPIFEDKIKEFINYRKQETRLHNGYNPEIINSQV
jgi:ribosomal protein S17